MILGHVTDLLAPRGEETFASKKRRRRRGGRSKRARRNPGESPVLRVETGQGERARGGAPRRRSMRTVSEKLPLPPDARAMCRLQGNYSLGYPTEVGGNRTAGQQQHLQVPVGRDHSASCSASRKLMLPSVQS
jgi:hypothetical protein